MSVNLKIRIGKLELKNPVLVASGTFGYADEFKGLVDFKKLGAIVTKTITIKLREGNAPPRIVETPAGMLNSIGLENPGLKVFIKEKLPPLLKIGIPVIVSISGDSDAEFSQLVQGLDKTAVSAIELNLSCPNLNKKVLVAQDAEATFRVVSRLRKLTRKPLIAKLTPNVTDIKIIAVSAQRAGADCISLINTISGMAVDIESREPKLGNITGGLSGPAIKPIALLMVWEAYKTVKIPIIGMGGIMNTRDALEFFICGASAIAVGTANFIQPSIAAEIASGIKGYLQKNKLKGIKDLIGSLKCKT